MTDMSKADVKLDLPFMELNSKNKIFLQLTEIDKEYCTKSD